MAFEAAINHAGMIEDANFPGHHAVALGAVVGGTNVIERLAGGMQTIVADLAGLVGHVMVELGDRPGNGQVAILAVL